MARTLDALRGLTTGRRSGHTGATESSEHGWVRVAVKRVARTISLSLLCGALLLSPASAGSALLFDAETGHVLYAEDADAPWYPASLTKMMTAYLAFEAIRDRRASDDTKIFISQNARIQPPTKL